LALVLGCHFEQAPFSSNNTLEFVFIYQSQNVCLEQLNSHICGGRPMNVFLSFVSISKDKNGLNFQVFEFQEPYKMEGTQKNT
jgi:hypothetical protein